MQLELAYYNDPVLRKKAEHVDQIDDELRQLVTNMIETMHITNGIGLAAPQVHRSIALFVTCVPIEKPNGRISKGVDRVFINPKIVSFSQETQTFSEGCLSIPNFYMEVTRPETITIQATDLEGRFFEETFSGFEATNFLHEYDHLQGILIIDYFTSEEKKGFLDLFRTSVGESQDQ